MNKIVMIVYEMNVFVILVIDLFNYFFFFFFYLMIIFVWDKVNGMNMLIEYNGIKCFVELWKINSNMIEFSVSVIILLE